MGASRSRAIPTSTANTVFLPSDAAFQRLLRDVGLPATRAGLDTLLRSRRGLQGVQGFSTVNDGFSRDAPTALSLLHAAVAGYGFVGGVSIPSSAFPVGALATLLPSYPPALLRGVVISNGSAAGGGGGSGGGGFVVVGAYNNASVILADRVFCGGFTVHLIDDILWPSVTPRDTVVRLA